MKKNKSNAKDAKVAKESKAKAAKVEAPVTEIAKFVAPSFSYDLKQGELVANCDAKADSLEVIRSAAYVLTDRAFALLKAGPKGFVSVVLQLKDAADKKALETLAKTFEDELATQRLRHQISKNNVSIREYIVEQAIRLAQQPADAPAPPQAPTEPELTDAQRKEIERLIAEVEEEIRAMAPAKATSDPLKISATWEETHAPKTENK